MPSAILEARAPRFELHVCFRQSFGASLTVVFQACGVPGLVGEGLLCLRRAFSDSALVFGSLGSRAPDENGSSERRGFGASMVLRVVPRLAGVRCFQVHDDLQCFEGLQGVSVHTYVVHSGHSMFSRPSGLSVH